VQQGQSIKLVHFQSTSLREGALSETSKIYWQSQEESRCHVKHGKRDRNASA